MTSEMILGVPTSAVAAEPVAEPVAVPAATAPHHPPVLDGEAIDATCARSAVIGAIIGFFLSTVVVTLALLAAFGLEVASAIGLGLFVGVWGGLGFGMMVGGVTALAEVLDQR